MQKPSSAKFRYEVLDHGTHRGGTQSILKAQTEWGPVVVKCYGRRRTRLREALRQLGHWTFAAKSPTSPWGRMRTEQECLQLWRSNGFDVFRTVEVGLKPPVARPHLVLEYVEGRTVYDILQDPAVSEAPKRNLLRRFSATWGRRHERARALAEPLLLHEHGSFRHVLAADDRLISFDLEIAWTRRRGVPHLIGREMIAFIRSLARVSESSFEPRLAVLVGAYPDHDLLLDSIRTAVTPSSPFRGMVSLLERLIRRRRARPKRAIAIAVEEAVSDARRLARREP